MGTPGVADAATLLRDFHFVDPTWGGSAFVPFWGRELDFSIYPDEEGITPRQLAILRAVLSYPQDLRPDFERALFAYYQADLDLTEPGQVWTLIDEPVVCIPWIFRTETAIEFELSFNCEWDPEHGLGVLYRDWQPVKFGGWHL